jgi:hypothetical protein
MKLEESPIFAKMKSEGKQSAMPLKESFGNLRNLSLVLSVLFGAVAGQAAISYASHSYVFYFLIQTLKVRDANFKKWVCDKMDPVPFGKLGIPNSS